MGEGSFEVNKIGIREPIMFQVLKVSETLESNWDVIKGAYHITENVGGLERVQ